MAKLDVESLPQTILGCALVSVLLAGVYLRVLPDIICLLANLGSLAVDCGKKPRALYSHLRMVTRDFRSGKYYKPWKSSKRVVIVTNKKHITELSETPILSQRAIYADMFGFKHTMNNLDHNEHKIARSRLYGRLLQVNGPTHLVALYPFLQTRLERSLHTELELGKKTDTNWISVPIASTVRKLASRMMSLAFFGGHISSDPEFAAALLRYPKDMVSSMAAFQITPSFLSSVVHDLITRRGQAMHTILDRLTWAMGKGRDSWDEPQHLKRLTILHNMTELTTGSDYWTPEVLAQALLGIWFAASHQPWMNLDFVVLELCSRLEYVELLRNEIGDYSSLDCEKLERLPLLDSFIKETVRLNPLDTLAIRRKAMKPFTFSNGGPHVPAGAMACVSSYDLMHDETSYPGAMQFDGRRFISAASSMKGTRFTDVSEKFPVWGYGSLACPGRFHASLVMKMVVAHLVFNYDLRLEDETAAQRWSWETFTMPYERTRVMLRKRVL